MKAGDFVRIVGVPFNTSHDLLGAVGELYYFDGTKFGITFASEIEGKNSHLLDIDQYTLLVVDKPLFGGIDFSSSPVAASGSGLHISTDSNLEWRPEPVTNGNDLVLASDGTKYFFTTNDSQALVFKGLIHGKVLKISKLKSNYKLIKLQKL